MVEDKGALPCPLSARQAGSRKGFAEEAFRFSVQEKSRVESRQGMAKEPLWDPFSAANSFTAKLADEERPETHDISSPKPLLP